MWEAIMNSSLPNPTPSAGILWFLNASSGEPIFTIIFVATFGILSRWCSITSNEIIPSYTLPTWPPEASTVTSWPFLSALVALLEPTIQGMPNSRETMAAWEVRPPLSVTMALAIFIIGSQSGSVISVTNTSPFLKEFMLFALCKTRTFPAPILDPTAIPETRTLLVFCNLYSFKIFLSSPETTVSGRACTMKSSSVFPSFAHSISIGW